MSSEASTRSAIEKVLISTHPRTVAELAEQVYADTGVDEAVFIEVLKEMAREKTVLLEPSSYEIETFLDYLFTITLSGWLWAGLALTILSIILVAITPDVFPLNVSRWVLGAIFVLFLPGYGLLQLLFPKGDEVDSLERLALDIGVSLAIVPLVGLMLNFTPWGIRLVPIVASIAIFNVAVLTAAAYRKYWMVRSVPI